MTGTTVVIGLGNIGGPIGARMVDAGHPVIGVDALAPRREAWLTRVAGGRACASPAEVSWPDVDRVCIVVRMTADALSVLDDVRVRSRRPIAVHVMTTLEPAAAAHLSARSGGHLRVLEQPVSGGAAGAAAGSLTVMSAGPLDGRDRDFLLGTVAARIVEFSGYGQPTLAKLLNNAVAAYNTRTATVMVALAARLGLDPNLFQHVVDSSSGASSMGMMIGTLADEQAELLTKDVSLLTTMVPDLPAMSVTDAPGFLDDLHGARRLLHGGQEGT